MGCCFSADSEPPQTNKGPRKCTDVCWIVLFATIWILTSSFAIWSYANNHPKRFISGTDSFGNMCGVKNKPIDGVQWSGMDLRTKPYIFYMNPADVSKTMKICVEKCADVNILDSKELFQFYKLSGSSLFRYDWLSYDREKLEDFDEFTKAIDIERGFGPIPKTLKPADNSRTYLVYVQRPILNRCIQKNKLVITRHKSDTINGLFAFIKENEVFEKIIDDLFNTVQMNSVLLLVALVLSMIVAFTINYFAAVISSVFLILTSLLFIGLTGFSWYIYIDIKFNLQTVQAIETMPDDIVNQTTTLAFAIFFSIVTLIVLVIISFMTSRVKMMQALFEETGSCIRSIPGILFQPMWTTLAMVMFIAFWTIVLLGILTAQKNVVFNEDTTRFNLTIPAQRFKYNEGPPLFDQNPYTSMKRLASVKHKRYDAMPYFAIIHSLLLLWTAQFILGCQQMTVSSSVASWYFSRDRENLDSPICGSIYRVMSYHLGSIALGSLLVFIKLLFLIPLFIRSQLQKYKETFQLLNCLLYCIECLFSWLARLLDYINESCYTIIAIEGTPYCKSASTAFNRLATNSARVIVLQTMGSAIILLGKLIVMVTISILSIYIYKDNSTVHFIYVPVVFSSICAYLIANSMLTIYSMSISVIFLCYTQDVETNSRTGGELFAPGSLLELAKADIQELKPGNLTISTEVNRPSANKYAQEPKIGFVYPEHSQI